MPSTTLKAQSQSDKTLVLTDEEYQVLLHSLDSFSRLCQGQVDRWVELISTGSTGDPRIDRDAIDNAVSGLKMTLFGLESRTHWSIGNDKVPPLGRNAYALYKKLRTPPLSMPNARSKR